MNSYPSGGLIELGKVDTPTDTTAAGGGIKLLSDSEVNHKSIAKPLTLYEK